MTGPFGIYFSGGTGNNTEATYFLIPNSRVAVPGYLPSIHGFAFANHWPAEHITSITLPDPFGDILRADDKSDWCCWSMIRTPPAMIPLPCSWTSPAPTRRSSMLMERSTSLNTRSVSSPRPMNSVTRCSLADLQPQWTHFGSAQMARLGQPGRIPRLMVRTGIRHSQSARLGRRVPIHRLLL